MAAIRFMAGTRRVPFSQKKKYFFTGLKEAQKRTYVKKIPAAGAEEIFGERIHHGPRKRGRFPHAFRYDTKA
jgi:hypothetical protein